MKYLPNPKSIHLSISIIILLMIVCSRVIASNGPEPLETLEAPGVILTFDDRGNIPHWVKQIPLFAKYGAHVTFGIESPDKLTDEQVEGLKELMAAGHEVASHGFRHVLGHAMVKEHGLDYWLETEVLPANSAFESHGIEVKSFIYPNSSNNEKMDKAIKPYFRHVRSGAGIPAGQKMSDVDAFFTPIDEVAEHFLLRGKGIDRSDEAWLEDHLFPALERAKARNEVLMLYAHNISVYSKGHHIQPEILELVLQRIAELNLKCYTLGQLPSAYPRDLKLIHQIKLVWLYWVWAQWARRMWRLGRHLL
jgi:peptidoglycan/xylan/chitin deacetylase (PgdA/CDA1 family)